MRRRGLAHRGGGGGRGERRDGRQDRRRQAGEGGEGRGAGAAPHAAGGGAAGSMLGAIGAIDGMADGRAVEPVDRIEGMDRIDRIDAIPAARQHDMPQSAAGFAAANAGARTARASPRITAAVRAWRTKAEDSTGARPGRYTSQPNPLLRIPSRPEESC